MTYSEARRLCTDHGSQLVTITNRYEKGQPAPMSWSNAVRPPEGPASCHQVQRHLSFESL